jgi:hypothetical protein
MQYWQEYIKEAVLDFFTENQGLLSSCSSINACIKTISGINDFFADQDEATAFLAEIRSIRPIVAEPDRRAYGDFQTNRKLAQEVVAYVRSKSNDFEFVLEPTCGKGNFILASLAQFERLKKIVGVEIHKPYTWQAKFDILDYFLSNPCAQPPEIDIIHGNAFTFDYAALARVTHGLKTLVIGNPPWVTNSELGSIDSENLPSKSNVKGHGGLDAVTGKSNFDIGEYISCAILKAFDRHSGFFAFLIKNSVAKNLIYAQKTPAFRIGDPEKLHIDAKKEFNASVDACLFLTRLNAKPARVCRELDFYSRELGATFGWHQNKFVSSIDDYEKANIIDGKSVFTWRSGMKHDCAKIMELDWSDNCFVNGFGEEVCLEDDLVYGLLKSSDLKGGKINSPRKFTIITQRKIGQETDYIHREYPLTYRYLSANKNFFDKRKSSIYREKPAFSIFGIGDYSFLPYKVAISGLYKSTHFTLVGPHEGKPLMLDDTCYFIGFSQLEMAEIACFLANSKLVQQFIKSTVFSDSKRPINKDALMRIDFEMAFRNNDFASASEKMQGLQPAHWKSFGELVKAEVFPQTKLF